MGKRLAAALVAIAYGAFLLVFIIPAVVTMWVIRKIENLSKRRP